MDNAKQNIKQELAMKWVQAESGNTYICKVGDIKGIENPDEETLRRLCMPESENPQND